MKLKINSNNSILLETGISSAQRVKAVEKVIDEHFDSFEFTVLDSKSKSLLDKLGTYILSASNESKEFIMSSYKERIRPIQETPVSCLSSSQSKTVLSMMYSNSVFP